MPNSSRPTVSTRLTNRNATANLKKYPADAQSASSLTADFVSSSTVPSIAAEVDSSLFNTNSAQFTRKLISLSNPDNENKHKSLNSVLSIIQSFLDLNQVSIQLNSDSIFIPDCDTEMRERKDILINAAVHDTATHNYIINETAAHGASSNQRDILGLEQLILSLHKLTTSDQIIASDSIVYDDIARNTEINTEIKKFKKQKSMDNNASNRLEFSSNNGTARVDAKKINRSIQMKTDVVKNKILDRSVSSSKSIEEIKNADHTERYKHLEEHLGLDTFSALNSGTMTEIDRIKRLEDRILLLEDRFPDFAAFIFQNEKNERDSFDPLIFKAALHSSTLQSTSKISHDEEEVGKFKVRDFENKIDKMARSLQ